MRETLTVKGIAARVRFPPSALPNKLHRLGIHRQAFCFVQLRSILPSLASLAPKILTRICQLKSLYSQPGAEYIPARITDSSNPAAAYQPLRGGNNSKPSPLPKGKA